jgi:hypothetical protein
VYHGKQKPSSSFLQFRSFRTVNACSFGQFMQMQPLSLHGFERLWQNMHKIRHFTDALVCQKRRKKAPYPHDTAFFYNLDLYRF